MEKDRLRDFALKARTSLMEQIVLRAAGLGITRNTVHADTRTVPVSFDKEQLDRLVFEVRERGFDRVVEDAACIWFNRFTCLRYMEVNGFLPTGVMVLSSPEKTNGQPEILEKALSLGWEIDKHFVRECIDTGRTGELYRYLILWQCRQLAGILPQIFGDCHGYEGLLLPDRLLCQGSVIRDMIESIDHEAFRDNVQVTGWLYQYFISRKKDEVYAGLRKNRKITKDDIPAATQLFTPGWIVRYMVENSLGRLWLEHHPNPQLRAEWHYYIDQAGQTGETKEQMKAAAAAAAKLSPREIKVLDPAMGSGHMLVYAFDVLYRIYLTAGYPEGDIPKLILENNLYGLDIDDRAGGLACFALMMKARSRNSLIFEKEIKLNLCTIKESNGLCPGKAVSEMERAGAGSVPAGLRMDIRHLIDAFKDAGEYGSLINLPDMDFEELRKWRDKAGSGKVSDLIEQACIMAGDYHVVVTNPPYMGIRGMNDRLAGYLNTHYKYSKYDLFTVFMELAKNRTKPGGYLSIINQHSWMFLSSYRKFRERFVGQCCICSMLHLGSNAFEKGIGTIVQTTAFVARKLQLRGYRSVFISLQNYGSSEEKKKALLNMLNGCEQGIKHTLCISDLDGIPGRPIAYWAGKSIVNTFINNKKLGELALPRQGMATSDNNRFVRYWYEVSDKDIGYGLGSTHEAAQSGYKWFPYNKGGAYRKWYGNNLYVVNWQNDGREIKRLAARLYGTYTRTIKNIDFYFKEAITYTFISNHMGARYSPPGAIFDVAGSSVFLGGEELLFVLAFLCSKLSKRFLYILNPTFNIQVGDIKNLPLPDIGNRAVRDRIVSLSRENIQIAKGDWDCCETSRDFIRHPLLVHAGGACTIKHAYDNWKRYAQERSGRLKANEEELNKIFIDACRLEGELTPELQDKDLTIGKSDRQGDIKRLISYAVGCMFGRYSLDEEGLVYAGGAFDPGRYISYPVKMDNIIPLTDRKYFKDSILSLFIDFVEVAFGIDNLEENLEYIAQSLGRNPGQTSRQAIDRYFLRSFYKDHLIMYNNRPIYWLLDTGKANGFKALVYMHRFDASTLSILQKDYLPRLHKIYREELSRQEGIIALGKCRAEIREAKKRKGLLEKRIEECMVYNKALAQAAVKGISIAPDDGVVLNYSKFQGLGIPEEKPGEFLKVDLLAKI